MLAMANKQRVLNSPNLFSVGSYLWREFVGGCGEKLSIVLELNQNGVSPWYCSPCNRNATRQPPICQPQGWGAVTNSGDMSAMQTQLPGSYRLPGPRRGRGVKRGCFRCHGWASAGDCSTRLAEAQEK